MEKSPLNIETIMHMRTRLNLFPVCNSTKKKNSVKSLHVKYNKNDEGLFEKIIMIIMAGLVYLIVLWLRTN